MSKEKSAIANGHLISQKRRNVVVAVLEGKLCQFYQVYSARK